MGLRPPASTPALAALADVDLAADGYDGAAEGAVLTYREDVGAWVGDAAAFAGAAGDTLRDAWTQGPSIGAPFDDGRRGPFGGVMGGKLYIAGGHNGTAYQDEVAAFDPATATWDTALTAMPAIYGEGAYAVVNGALYCGPTNSGRDLYVYHPGSDTWVTKAQWPFAGGGAGCRGCGLGGRYYVTGGSQGDRWYVYDILTDTWQDTGAPKVQDVREAVCTAHGGYAWLAGGINPGTGQPVANLQRYDPIANVWEALAPMPVALAGSTGGWFGNFLYIFGGNGDVPTVLVYSALLDQWEQLQDMTPTNPRDGVPVCAELNGRLWLVGGASPGGTDELWAYG